MIEYKERMQKTPWDNYYSDNYRFVMRRMLNQVGERTLIGAIVPKKTAHIHTVFGLACRNLNELNTIATELISLPFDYYVKSTGKSDILFGMVSKMPYLRNISVEAIIRTLLLSCLTEEYAELWCKSVANIKKCIGWSTKDTRLHDRFSNISNMWSVDTPIRSDYERRQALVEIDVLISMGLGLTLEQLKLMYRIQFPTLQKNEADTWYDANGRIVFTCNTALSGVGYDRKTWENGIKGAPAGQKFYRTITDDTMPGGPVERTIEYVAPFDRCNREQDYETAWKFFEEKFRKQD